MIDERWTDDSGNLSGIRSVSLNSLARRVPGAAPNAPKRNVLVALGYLFLCLLAAGLLWTGL